MNIPPCNFWGGLWILGGFAAAVNAQEKGILSPSNDSMNSFLFIAASFVVIMDLTYRFFISRKKYKEQGYNSDSMLDIDLTEHWLTGNNFGGSLFFLPTWCSSILLYLWFVYIVQIES